LVTEIVRQGSGCEHVNRDAEQLAEFIPNGANVQQCGFGSWLDQEIEVALVGVFAMEDQPEYADLLDMMPKRDFANGVTMGLQG
jgi:sulfite reductase alpha subunit-like flavoprotein